MALRTNEAQLSLFPVDLMVVMAAQPAQAVSPSLPTFGFRQEENGTVTLEEVLENGLQYLREQAGPGHHFSQAEVSKALSAFKQWMKAIPEDEDGSRYARYFITEFMDSGFCLHPDDYPAYAFPAKPSAQTEATAEDDDVPERDEADQTAQADVSPAVAEAIAEDDGENLLEGEVPLDLSILKMLLASRVFNSVTTTQYIRDVPWRETKRPRLSWGHGAVPAAHPDGAIGQCTRSCNGRVSQECARDFPRSACGDEGARETGPESRCAGQSRSRAVPVGGRQCPRGHGVSLIGTTRRHGSV